ncbi:MerR family transcriptional regulator [Anaerorhabdus sp.]|uniref:MerR family transcriptional regulator n=1 Tax=Anaerorhabdus sp. TaxID=1872524 RepID=UPI002FCA6B09
MLKISDFSKLSRISIRMLRFYDEQDLLKPCMVKENGYRYYESTQLRVALHIHYLSYLGFSTAKIRRILSTYLDGNDIVQYLQSQLEEMKDEQSSLIEKIDSLTKTINKIKQEEMLMSYKVEVKDLPARNMMCKRGIIPTYQHEGLLWKGLMEELHSLNMDIQYPTDSKGMAVFFDDGYKETDVDVEIRMDVVGEYNDTENIKFKNIPPVKVASITFTGGYEHITEVCIHIANWISEHNYEIIGPDFSIYHVGYSQTQNPEEFVTEICYPIQ